MAYEPTTAPQPTAPPLPAAIQSALSLIPTLATKEENTRAVQAASEATTAAATATQTAIAAVATAEAAKTRGFDDFTGVLPRAKLPVDVEKVLVGVEFSPAHFKNIGTSDAPMLAPIFPEVTGIALEAAATFAAINASTDKRLVEVAKDESNGNARTLYLHLGTSLLRIATTAIALAANPGPATPAAKAWEALAYTAVSTGQTTDADGTIHNNNTGTPAGAKVTKHLGPDNGDSVQFRVAENYYGTQGAFLVFTNDASDYNYYGQNNSVGIDGGQVKYGATKIGAANDVTENTYVRLVRDNTNDFIVQVSQDGSTFRPVGTAIGVLNGLTTPFIVIKFSSPSVDRILREVSGYGLVAA